MSRKTFSSALLVTLVSTPLAFLLAAQAASFSTTGLLVGTLLIVFIASAGSAWIAVRASIPSGSTRRAAKPAGRTSSARGNAARSSSTAVKEKPSRTSEVPTPAQGPREAGQVKWFNASKGFGFITRDSGEDIFVHFRSIRGDGHRVLKDGQRVEFSVSMGDKGMQADDVASLSR